MSSVVHLVLEDGTVFTGESFGAQRDGWGEVVFNTTMTGYQEVLTDPSYAGQMVALTYPLVGNYGINLADFESRRIQAAALIVRQHCDLPSHGSSNMTLDAFLKEYDVPGISGIDTRALTRRLRNHGVMMGLLTSDNPDAGRQKLAELPRYDNLDLVSTVTTSDGYAWDGSETAGYPSAPPPEGIRRILVTDVGLKYNILRLLQSRGCEVIAVPATTPADVMLKMQPSGLLLSPGPGDPELLGNIVDNVRQLLGRANHGHLPGPPTGRPRVGRAHLQAQVRTPGRQPPGQGPGIRPGPHHRAESRLRRRRRQPALRPGSLPD